MERSAMERSEMRMRLVRGLAGLVPLSLALGAAVPAVGQQAQGLRRVPMITAIECEVRGQSLFVFAEGLVPSAGWTDARLEPQRELNGIWEFALRARPPAGDAAQVVRRISAERRVSTDGLDGVRGLRVLGTGPGVAEISINACR
jgi:hypothetical protein